ncbi:hypothetical protein ACQB60_10885 [Actinomycetota bacterium Odt1-20B]
MSAKRIITKASLVAAGAATLVGVAVSPAAAGSKWHAISGVVYSGGAWYQSNNERTVTNNSKQNIDAKFTELPKGGLSFKLVGKSNNTLGSVKHWGKTETDQKQRLWSKAKNKSKFYTMFKSQNGCRGCSPYEFKGSLWH